MSEPYYITTAIAYPNGDPHIGHAYEYIATDAVARFKRLDGFDVRYLTGTDVHGQKMAETAAALGIPTEELAKRNSDVFQRLQEKLNISFDRFIRTSDADHYEASIELWKRMNESGDIYLDIYAGWYSVRDEGFVTEAETTVNADGVRVATETGAPVTWTEEQTYFFRLSNYADKLMAHYEAHPGVHRAQCAAQRGGQLRLRRPARLLHLAHDVRLGRAGARAPRPRDVRVGRRVDELSDRCGLPRHVIGVVHPVLAGRPAHDRQGHHPVPHRVLAGVSDVGGNRVAAQGLRARLRPQPRREDEQVGRKRGRPDRVGRRLRCRPGALLLPARGAVRPGRQLQRGSDHRPHQRRPRQRVGQPGAAVAVDGRQEPRRDRPRARRIHRRRHELLEAADGLLERVRGHYDATAMHLALEAIWSVLGAANKYFSAQEPWVLRKSDRDQRGSAPCCTRRWRRCGSRRC